MSEEVRKQTPYEMLRKVVDFSREAIEREYGRSANDWLSCFGSRVFQVETLLNVAHDTREVSPEVQMESQHKLEALKTELVRLKGLYPQKADIPPLELQEELLKKLHVV